MLVSEFQKLGSKLQEQIENKSKPSPIQWTPSEQQKSRAEETLSRFLQAIDDGRYKDAYGLLTPGLKSIMTFERSVTFEESFRAASGGDPARSDIRITWYNDPPEAQAPGVYAAFDITCRYHNFNVCSEVIILHEQDNGAFLVMRHERNYVEKDTEAKLRE